MSEKWHQSEIRIVINDRSQGSVAKHVGPKSGWLALLQIYNSI